MFTAVIAIAVFATAPKTLDQSMENVRDRWNVSVGDGPRWEERKFPHPMFSCGSAKLYGDFARALVQFLDENVDYLKQGDLGDATLSHSIDRPGKNPGVVIRETREWSLILLVTAFARPEGRGDHDAVTRDRLLKHAKTLLK